MPEIGETLREARMRRRIDVAEVEAATKIRAKYLRALENEEWDLLPGPTFVKTFLRTYADYLGLDSRLLVEEYRQRYERVSSQDLTPFGPGLGGQRRRRRPRGAYGPVLMVGAGVVALLAVFWVIGTKWGSSPSESTMPAQPAAKPHGPAKSHHRHRRRARPTRVSVRLLALSDVYVCLVDAAGHAVVDRRTLAAGSSTRTFRSRRFMANFGNGGVRMRVNGRTYAATPSSNPIGYELRPTGRPRRLPDRARARLCA
jgi:hypothetical protein